MTLEQLYMQSGLIKDNTEIVIRNEFFGVLTKGQWFTDGVLEYTQKEIESFTWQDDNKIFIDLKGE